MRLQDQDVLEPTFLSCAQANAQSVVDSEGADRGYGCRAVAPDSVRLRGRARLGTSSSCRHHQGSCCLATDCGMRKACGLGHSVYCQGGALVAVVTCIVTLNIQLCILVWVYLVF